MMMPSSPPTEALVEQVCALCREAGAKILHFYRTGTEVTLKKDASPLTDADRASHELLVRSLPPLLPGIPVASEESAEPARAASAHGRFWLVDPLDGTKEFLKGTGEFTVNVALIENGRPVMGVVHAPALDLTYYAAPGMGAWRRPGGQSPVGISTRRPAPTPPSVVASKDHAGPLVQAMLARLPGAELKSLGSSLKFCLVAEGKADLYLRDLPTMEWDTAAAQCVVETAGGAVYDLASGSPLPYGKPALRNGPILTVGDTGFAWQGLVTKAEG